MTFPYHKQETAYTCGAACMRMAFERFGIKKTEKQMMRLLGTNKVKGTWEKRFPKIAEKYKLTYLVKRKGSIRDLKKLNKGGWTIVVCFYHPSQKTDHYAILKKFEGNHIYFYDPWLGPEHHYKTDYFEKIWKTTREKDLRWFIALKK